MEPAVERKSKSSTTTARRPDESHADLRVSPITVAPVAGRVRSSATPEVPVRVSSGATPPDVPIRRFSKPGLNWFRRPKASAAAADDTAQITSSEVVARISRIPIVAQHLGTDLVQGPTLLEHVNRALLAFDKHLALKSAGNSFVNEAIRIATIIDATAAELARTIVDPTLKPQIAKEIIGAYRAELTEALGHARSDKQKERTTRALDVASVLVGSDPLMLFMQKKMKKEDAAWRIRDMAAEAKIRPFEMFRSLRMRFEMEMGSHSKNEIAKGRLDNDQLVTIDPSGQETTGKGGFDLADLVGEISPTFHDEIVLASAVDPKKRKGKGTQAPAEELPAWADGGLVMQNKARSMLTELENSVMDSALKATSLSPQALAQEQAKSGTTLSAKQSEHFARLRAEEASTAGDYEQSAGSPKQFVATKFSSRYNMSETDAAALVDDVLAELAVVPLTLSSNLDNLFKERSDKAAEPFYGSAYKSEPALMQQDVDLSELVGKGGGARKATAKSIGRPDAGFQKSRGQNYMRWRRDKDERETGYHGLGADDLPVFAAVNPNFMVTKGGNANMATWDSATKKWTGTTYGENYYGNVHMLLKDSVRPRSTLIARGRKDTKGRRIERTDLTFLLADMCRMYMFDYVDALVASVKKPGTTVLTNMDAEVHVYGGLDVATDVQTIYVSPAAFAATDGPAGRLKAFAHKHGITVQSVGTMPPAYDITAKQGTNGGIDLKALLATPPVATTT